MATEVIKNVECVIINIMVYGIKIIKQWMEKIDDLISIIKYTTKNACYKY